MEITRKIVKQPFAPDTTDVLWLDSSGDSDVLKSFCNGQWKEVAGGNNKTGPYIIDVPTDFNMETFYIIDSNTFSDARDAYLHGYPVLIRGFLDGGRAVLTVNCYNDGESGSGRPATLSATGVYMDFDDMGDPVFTRLDFVVYKGNNDAK